MLTSAMQVRELLNEAIRQLNTAGVETPRLDAEVIFSHVLDQDRSWLYAHSHDIMSIELRDRLTPLIQRRAAREPVAYILGQREFFGLTFEVTPAVLIPRPETELLVEEALRLVRNQTAAKLGFIVDVGTGSGCIVVTLAVHLPQAQFVAVDLSAEALIVARRNAQRHGVLDRIQFVQGDLLAGIGGPLPLIVSNPPYIAENELPALAPEIIDYEPLLALTDHSTGLSVIERLLLAAVDRLGSEGALLIELGAGQGSGVLDMAQSLWPTVSLQILKDLAGHDRLLVGQKR
jgi:release factor glutamine methyltransferase